MFMDISRSIIQRYVSPRVHHVVLYITVYHIVLDHRFINPLVEG